MSEADLSTSYLTTDKPWIIEPWSVTHPQKLFPKTSMSATNHKSKMPARTLDLTSR